MFAYGRGNRWLVHRTLVIAMGVIALAGHVGCSSPTSAPPAGAGESAVGGGAMNDAVTNSGDTTIPPVDSASPATGGTFPIDSATARPADTAAATVGTVIGSGEVSLRVVDAEAYAAALAKHQGQVVLVDFWATWCGPCKEQFPHSVELFRKWKEKGLAVVTVSFDGVEKQQEALEFLQQQGAVTENLLSLHGAGVQSGVSFDIVGGALPYYKLYDRSGKLRYQFTGNIEGLEGVLKIGELDQRIEELMGS